MLLSNVQPVLSARAIERIVIRPKVAVFLEYVWCKPFWVVQLCWL